MNKMIINGKDVAQGRVVKALEAMLDGADDATLRELSCYKYDEQFYKVNSEVLGTSYMVRKEFNCLTVWMSYCGGTSFNDGDEFVQDAYHPLCILSKPREDRFNPEWNDVCMDLVNALIRTRVLTADKYLTPADDE